MIAVSIKGTGTLDMADANLGLKRENPLYSWSKLSSARSTQFSVPATIHNRRLLGWAEDVSEYGYMMRLRLDAQLQYDGGTEDGILEVTSFDGHEFSCVFYYDISEELEILDGLKCNAVETTMPTQTWNSHFGQNADAAGLSSAKTAIIKYKGVYDTNATQLAGRWTWLPAMKLKELIEDLLTNAGIRHSISLDGSLWLVSPTLNSPSSVSGTISKTTVGGAVTIASALQPYLSSVTSKLYFNVNSNALFPRGAVETVATAITVQKDIKLTFPSNWPSYLSIYTKKRNLNAYDFVPLTDRWKMSLYTGYRGMPLAGRTVTLHAGDFFFVLDERDFAVNGGNTYPNGYGWTKDASPFSYTFGVVDDGTQIAYGGTWNPKDNMPDMTVTELMRSAALLDGRVLYWDKDDGIVIDTVGMSTNTIPLTEVRKMGNITRCVADWGNSTREVIIKFDSEDYVVAPLVDSYFIDNEQINDNKEEVIKFSEGNDDGGDVVINDIEIDSSSNVKLTAKKWTVAKSGNGTYLDRVALVRHETESMPSLLSCAVTVETNMDVADFLDMQKNVAFTFRGVSLVWTSATWNGGVATLQCQVVPTLDMA